MLLSAASPATLLLKSTWRTASLSLLRTTSTQFDESKYSWAGTHSSKARVKFHTKSNMTSCGGVSSDSSSVALDALLLSPSPVHHDHDRRRRGQRHRMPPPTTATTTATASSSASALPSKTARKRRMGQQRTHGRASRRSHPLLTATAAATAAAALVSTMSSSSWSTGRIGPSLSLSPITPVAAFGVGPLHLSSSNVNCDMVVGRRSSSLPRDVGSTGTVVGVPSSSGQQSWGPQHGRSRRHCPPRPGDEQRFRDGAPPPPPLRMAVTDPETLLGAEELLVEELAEQLRRRTAAGAAAAAASNCSGGATASPARRRGRPTKASGSSSSASTSKSSLTSDSASIYFGLHRRQQQQTRRTGLLELDIDLGLDGNTNQGPGRSNGGRPSARLGFEVPPLLVQEEPKQSHTAPPQIIESDMEVLELGAISLVPQEDYVGGAEQILEHTQKDKNSNEDASSVVDRSLRPVSSTPAQQRQSANARRSSKVAAPERKSTLASGRRKPAAPQRKGRKSLTAARGKSKSSTMPGFQERNANLSGRRRAHRDGVRIAEEKSGKDLEKIVNTQSSSSARRRANSMAMYKGSASVPDSLVAYTKEIHDATQRITPAEEKELGAKTQEAIRLQNVYSSLEEDLGREPTDEEWCAVSDGVGSVEELRATIDQGMEAKNRLVESNLRMVQGVVNTYIRNGLGSQYNAGDLMQEGTMALIRAAEKFEPERGFRFSTYAMYWIRSAVKSSQIVQSRVIQVPQRLHETHKRVQKVERGLKAELGRPPTNEELAKSSDLSELQLGRCKKAMAQKCVSLDATIQNKFKPGTGGNRKDTMLDIVNGKFQDEQYGKTQQELMKEALIDSLRSVLSPHEVDLLLLRFGLMDERTLPHGFAGPLTIAEVSRLVGLKPDKVRRMINKCLSKLRPVMETEWLDYQSKTIV